MTAEDPARRARDPGDPTGERAEPGRERPLRPAELPRLAALAQDGQRARRMWTQPRARQKPRPGQEGQPDLREPGTGGLTRADEARRGTPLRHGPPRATGPAVAGAPGRTATVTRGRPAAGRRDATVDGKSGRADRADMQELPGRMTGAQAERLSAARPAQATAPARSPDPGRLRARAPVRPPAPVRARLRAHVRPPAPVPARPPILGRPMAHVRPLARAPVRPPARAHGPRRSRARLQVRAARAGDRRTADAVLREPAHRGAALARDLASGQTGRRVRPVPGRPKVTRPGQPQAGHATPGPAKRRARGLTFPRTSRRTSWIRRHAPSSGRCQAISPMRWHGCW